MPILRAWRPQGQSRILVARSNIGTLIITSLDPWKRLESLRPHDYLLSQASAIEPVLTLTQLNRREASRVAHVLCRSLDVVWPVRGRSGLWVGVVDRAGRVVAEGRDLPEVGQLVGVTGRHLRQTWVNGQSYRGFSVVTRPPRACGPLPLTARALVEPAS